MDPVTKTRLFGTTHAFDSPVVRFLVAGLAIVLIAAPLLILIITRLGKPNDKLKKDLWDRYKSWLLFIPMMFGPVLLGAAYVFAAVVLLALFCYRELARATGLFREAIISAVVVLGIVAINLAAADHWYGFFVALTPLVISLMAAAAILSDNPVGYIQRVALGIFAFMVLGVCCTTSPISPTTLITAPSCCGLSPPSSLNDIFAYITGKSLGRRKLAPHTSPNKTIGGAVGALVLTTVFAGILGHFVFKGSPVDQPIHLIALGLILSIAGQVGDLTLSSVKHNACSSKWPLPGAVLRALRKF